MSEQVNRHPFPVDQVRLDKWLWAARFFKTRSLAKQAIEGGKVHYNGARSKVSKDVELGAELTIRVGNSERVVEVVELSDQRRGASDAQWLYRETEESIAKREAAAEQWRAMSAFDRISQRSGRPTKKDRRQIHKFREDST